MKHALVTPNVPELAVLAGATPASTWEELVDQGQQVAGRFHVTILIKGGHLAGATVYDAVVQPSGDLVVFESPRIQTPNTHGTGCSLSPAMATLRPQREGWHEALADAKRWLTNSISAGHELDVGTGHGPISHFADLWQKA